MLALSFAPASPALQSAAGPRPGGRLVTVGPWHPERTAVERFIRRVYRDRYGANPRQFAPTLVALRDATGELVAAAGYRCAAEQPLFLERYLQAPVETLLAADPARPPSRARIVEVGHLAASRAGEGRRLIMLLGPHLAAQGFEWVVSTLTEELRHLFARLGIVPLALGAANPEVLGAEASNWGSYYDHRPAVLAGQLQTALRTLARRREAR